MPPAASLQPKTFQRASPTPKQIQLWDIVRSVQPDALALIGYGGAAGGGKTRAIAELALDYALDFPGSRLMIGRKDFADLRTTTMLQFDMHTPRSLIWRKNDSEHWRDIKHPDWPEGLYSRVYFRELKDYLGLGSEEFNFIGIDEAGEVPSNSARMLLGRMRWRLLEPVMSTEKTPQTPWGRKSAKYPNGKLPPRIFVAASNPIPGWFEKWFVKRELPEDLLRGINASVHFIPSLPKDNPFLPTDYEAQLRLLWPADWVKRMMEGRWDAFVGQVYPMFNHDMHCYRAQLPDPKEWVRIIGGLDFGGLNPFDHYSAGMVAIQLKSNRIIRVAEFEERGEHIVDRQMAWMLAQEARWCNEYTGSRIWWVADKSQTAGIGLWKRMGFNIRMSRGGWDSVETGCAMVARRLEPDPTGYPGSFYLPSLTIFPERMVAYRYDEPPDDEPARRVPVKKGDDLLDADRYMHELLDMPYGAPAPNQFPVVSQREEDFEMKLVFR